MDLPAAQPLSTPPSWTTRWPLEIISIVAILVLVVGITIWPHRTHAPALSGSQPSTAMTAAPATYTSVAGTVAEAVGPTVRLDTRSITPTGAVEAKQYTATISKDTAIVRQTTGADGTLTFQPATAADIHAHQTLTMTSESNLATTTSFRAQRIVIQSGN